MSTKIKGILKGLRFIYQVFEEKKEHDQEIQIGLPTDVKHVAHIGWEGACVDQPPSWMKEFNEDHPDQSLDNNGTQAGGKSKKVSRDSSTKSKQTKERSTTPTNSTSDNSQVLNSSTSTKQRRPKKQLSTSTASKNSPSKQPTRKPKDPTEPSEEGSVKRVRQKKAKNSENGGANRPLKANNIIASPPS